MTCSIILIYCSHFSRTISELEVPMFENMNVAIDPKSEWKTTTPLANTLQLPFYLLEWGHFIAFRNYFTERADSFRYLLFYTLSGCGKLVYEGRTYFLTPNAIAIIYCGTPHRYETLQGEDWDFLWFHYNGSAAASYYKLYNEEELFLYEISPGSREADLVRKITSCPGGYSFEKDLVMNQWILDLMTLCILSKRKTICQQSPALTEKLKTALDYMTEHLKEKITISDISHSVYLSQYHFQRLFKKQTGVAPYEYLIHLRINRAKDLLVSTNAGLEDIAASCGFSDSKNLIYNFKRIVHTTPNQYRKEFSPV